jgi:hypothetical protein
VSQLYKRLVGTHKRQADEIIKLRGKILRGTMVAIDPGSNSLGFSFWVNGVMVHSGSIKAKGTVGPRLQTLAAQLEQEGVACGVGAPDVVVIEFVRSSTGHIYLTWAAGVAVAALGAEHTLEVTTGAWRKNVDKTYVKGDERDAIEIGKFAVTLCKEASKARRNRGKKHTRLRPRWGNAA